MRTLIVVPARYASTRLPGKPLVTIAGRTMVSRVAAMAAALFRLRRGRSRATAAADASA